MDGTRSYPEDVKFVVESNSRLHPKEKPAPQKTDAQAVHNSTSAKRHPGIFSTWALRHEWQRATKSLMSWDPLGFRTGKSSQAASFMVDRPFPSKKNNHFRLFHAIPPFLGHTHQPVQAANCPWCRRRWYVQSACAPHHPSPIPWFTMDWSWEHRPQSYGVSMLLTWNM